MKLSEAKAGMHGRITAASGDSRFLSRIVSIGLTAGCPVTILRNEKKQPLLIYGRDTMIALNRGECEKIEWEAIENGN